MKSSTSNLGPVGTKLGPVGTRLGTFIINENLNITNEYYTLIQYDISLKKSIDIGLLWLQKNIPILGIDKYKDFLKKLENQFESYGYTDSINQKIIESSHDVLSKLTSKDTPFRPKGSPEIKVKNKQDNHLGALTLDSITLADVNMQEYIFAETSPGIFALCLRVKHKDHWDILPYNYIAEKIKDFTLNI